MMIAGIPDNFPIVYSDDHPALAPLRAAGEVRMFSTRHEGAAALVERCQGCEALINVRAYSKFTDSVFQALPDLRMISVMGTGTDNIDLASAARHGVTVCNTPTAPTTSVAEFTVALTLAITKQIIPMHNDLSKGEWHHRTGIELRGKTFGLIGLGLIAQEVIPVVRALGMRVVGWSLRHDEERARTLGIELAAFDDLLATADVVSLHLRASPRTQHIIGKRELALMKPEAYLINTARGAIVDEDALVDALRNRTIAGAAVDVYSTEPLPATSPLLTVENILLTPHVAWVTDGGLDRMARYPVENVLSFLRGAPQNVVAAPAS